MNLFSQIISFAGSGMVIAGVCADQFEIAMAGMALIWISTIATLISAIKPKEPND